MLLSEGLYAECQHWIEQVPKAHNARASCRRAQHSGQLVSSSKPFMVISLQHSSNFSKRFPLFQPHASDMQPTRACSDQ